VKNFVIIPLVDIGFKDAKLERTFVEGRDVARLGSDVFRAFVQKVQILADVGSEGDLYAIKSLHFEKLFGNREGQRSIRLNKRFRLIFSIHKATAGSVVWIIEVVDYH
jgi:toxin HigB-1